MRTLSILFIFLTSCSTTTPVSGPTPCERQLTLCRLELELCQQRYPMSGKQDPPSLTPKDTRNE